MTIAPEGACSDVVIEQICYVPNGTSLLTSAATFHCLSVCSMCKEVVKCKKTFTKMFLEPSTFRGYAVDVKML